MSLVSVSSLSFLLSHIISSLVARVPSQQEKGPCGARGRKTDRLRARVRDQDEARQDKLKLKTWPL